MRTKVVDISTLFGIFAAFALVTSAIMFGVAPKGFLDIKAVAIVVLGSFAVVIASFSFTEVWKAVKITIYTVLYRAENLQDTARCALDVAVLVRKDGLLELDKQQDLMKHNRFFSNGINMLVDGINPSEIDKSMDEEIKAISYRHSKSVEVLRKLAEVAPAMGLIGTLVGLIQMLSKLDDPSSIGPSMAVALLTTFYGAVMAFMVFNPLATKLERNSRHELMTADIYARTVNFVAKNENPRRLELVINSILPNESRIRYFK